MNSRSPTSYALLDRPRALLLALALFALLGPACGSSVKRKPTFPAFGKVLWQGQPARDAQVFFHPLDDTDTRNWPDGFPRGKVGADGMFQLGTQGEKDGAPAGNYVVIIIWPEASAKEEDEEPRDRLQGRYRDPRKSTIRRQITEGPNELETIHLK